MTIFVESVGSGLSCCGGMGIVLFRFRGRGDKSWSMVAWQAALYYCLLVVWLLCLSQVIDGSKRIVFINLT